MASGVVVLLQDLLIEPLYLVVFGVNIPMSEDDLLCLQQHLEKRLPDAMSVRECDTDMKL